MSIRKNPIDFTIGCDPEFVSVENDKLIVASDYVDIADKFGRDAYDKLFEIKPAASVCPVAVTRNIQKIMSEAVIENPRFLNWRWVCDSIYKNCPMGGHLHVGIGPTIIKAKDACSLFLDHYVGAITLLLENRKRGLARRAYRRKNYRYGFASDFREKKHGFEYRSPSSWITSPEIATAILCLFKTVCYEMINNKSFKPTFYTEPEDFTSMNTVKLRQSFPSMWNEITRMALYPKYRSHLDLLYSLISEGKTWLSKRDMRETWGLVDIKPPKKKEMEDIWSWVSQEYVRPIVRIERKERKREKKQVKNPFKIYYREPEPNLDVPDFDEIFYQIPR